MTDDMKEALMRFRKWEFEDRAGWTIEDGGQDHATILRWLNGEDARTAAAVAAAREEQVQSDLNSMQRSHQTGESWSASITSTPLADRIAELEELSRLLNGTINLEQSRASDWKARALSMTAERDALRAQVEAARALLTSLLPGANRVNRQGVDHGLACGKRYLSVAGYTVAMEGDPCRDAGTPDLRWNGADFEAIAEKFAAPIRDVLRAMDEAKPK